VDLFVSCERTQPVKCVQKTFALIFLMYIGENPVRFVSAAGNPGKLQSHFILADFPELVDRPEYFGGLVQ